MAARTGRGQPVPVLIAGSGVSRSQRLLARCGKHIPKLPFVNTPREIRLLAYWNTICFVAIIGFPPFLLLWITSTPYSPAPDP